MTRRVAVLDPEQLQRHACATHLAMRPRQIDRHLVDRNVPTDRLEQPNLELGIRQLGRRGPRDAELPGAAQVLADQHRPPRPLPFFPLSPPTPANLPNARIRPSVPRQPRPTSRPRHRPPWAALPLVLALTTSSCAEPNPTPQLPTTEVGGSSKADDPLPSGSEETGLPPTGDLDSSSSSGGEFDDQPPIAFVLMHGYNAAPGTSFAGVAERLAAQGHIVFEPAVHPFAGVEQRANDLADFLDEVTRAGIAYRFHLIAHSMGGLDARYLTSMLGFEEVVVSVTTIATPHRGTPFADETLRQVEDFESEVNWATQWLGGTFSEVAEDPDTLAALRSLSVAEAEPFNNEVRDQPGVYYQSFGAVATLLGRDYMDYEWTTCGTIATHGSAPSDRVPVALYVPHALMSSIPDNASDGLIPTSSQVWGNFRGCLPADHLEVAGDPDSPGINPRTGYDAVRFFELLAEELADLNGCEPDRILCVPSEDPQLRLLGPLGCECLDG